MLVRLWKSSTGEDLTTEDSLQIPLETPMARFVSMYVCVCVCVYVSVRVCGFCEFLFECVCVCVCSQSDKLQEQQDLISELQLLLSGPGPLGFSQRPHTAPQSGTRHSPTTGPGRQVGPPGQVEGPRQRAPGRGPHVEGPR